MDGAGAVRSFLSITLPALRATIASVAALGVILTLQQFDLISGLTEGGPANTSNVAQFWSWQLSFEAFEIGTGSAIAVVMLVVVSVVAWFYVRSDPGGARRVTRRRLGGAAWTAVAAAIVGVYLFPLYWMYVTGLKGNAEIYRSPPSFWPIHPRWSVPAVIRNHGLPHYLFNSLLIASISTVLAVGFGTGAAYVLARRRGALIDAALFAILMVPALPASLLATPMFVAFDQTGLLHLPRLAVALAQTGRVMPSTSWLCRAGFLAVPRELEQAAVRRWRVALAGAAAGGDPTGAQHHPGGGDPDLPAVAGANTSIRGR